jgi:peptidoglycan/LPS O-acetylase OafA/YrhL
MAVLEEGIKFLDNLGLWDVVIPFILVFTLVYAVLEKVKIFKTKDGDPKRQINAMIALIIAFFVLISAKVLDVINIVAHYMVIVIIAAILVAIIIGLMGYGGIKTSIIIPIGFIVVGALVLYILGYLQILSMPDLRRFFELPIIGILVMILVVWYVLSGKPAPQKAAAAKGGAGAGAAPGGYELEKSIKKPKGTAHLGEEEEE